MRLSPKKISQAVQGAIEARVMDLDVDTSSLFYCFDLTKERLQELKEAFPTGTLHAVAVKANPLGEVLKFISASGVGLEAATLPELHISLATGLPADHIVYDSPVKSRGDLEYAIAAGCHINADSLEELARIDEVLSDLKESAASFGLRVNPQVGDGNIAATSVAGEYSKFGVPLSGRKSEILEAYSRYSWLTGIHIHIGSQGCAMQMLLDGARVLDAFVLELEGYLAENGQARKISKIDIGGGLPAHYDRTIEAPSMTEYSRLLVENAPNIFSGDRQIITEFGRHLHAASGFVVSRVEYVKYEDTKNTLMTHVGADMFLRECYRPDDWFHEIIVLRPDGSLKQGEEMEIYNVAGPLCFAGDIIARDRLLPKVEPGDYIVVMDSGAYTVAMWSRYNSRQIPAVIGYGLDEGKFKIIRARETLDEVLDFWS